jgi:hypothetical protein
MAHNRFVLFAWRASAYQRPSAFSFNIKFFEIVFSQQKTARQTVKTGRAHNI